MTVNQQFFWKGMVVMMLMMLCLELMTQAQAARQRKARPKDRGRGCQRQGKGRGKVPLWLKQVTGRGNKAVTQAFCNLQDKNDLTVATLREQIPLMDDLSEYTVTRNCSTLFGSPVNYTADAVTGRSDVISRLKAFHRLFHKAKTHCQINTNITDLLDRVTNALGDYITVLTPDCDRHASPQQSCGDEEGSYRCEPALCRGHSDMKTENVRVLSIQLQCFLGRLRSSRPLHCTRKGPQRQRKRNRPKKAKKSRKALNRALKAFRSQRHLPAWETVCQQGKITLILHANMTSQEQKAGDSSQAQKKPGGKKEANLADLCQGGVRNRITNNEIVNALSAIGNSRVTR